MFFTFASFMNFKLFQIDMKSVFLNIFIQEKVYVEQPLGFEDYEFPNHIFYISKCIV